MNLRSVLENYDYAALAHLAENLGLDANLPREAVIREIIRSAILSQRVEKALTGLRKVEFEALRILKNVRGEATMDALEMELSESGIKDSHKLISNLMDRGLIFAYSLRMGGDANSHFKIFVPREILEHIEKRRFSASYVPSNVKIKPKELVVPDDFFIKSIALLHNINIVNPRILKSGRINQKSLKEISELIYAPLILDDFRTQNIWGLAYYFLLDSKFVVEENGRLKVRPETFFSFFESSPALRLSQALQFWQNTEFWNDIFLVNELNIDDIVIQKFGQENFILNKSSIRNARQHILDFLRAYTSDRWIDFAGFLHQIKSNHIEFLLPRDNAESNSYHLLRERTEKNGWGRVLSSHSLDDWDLVEGRIIARIFTEVFLPLNLIEIGNDDSEKPFPFSHFKLTAQGEAALNDDINYKPAPSEAKNKNKKPLTVLSNFEVMIYPERIKCNDFARLVESFDLVSYGQIIKTVVSKKSIVNYLQHHLDIEVFLELLTKLSREEIPQNILFTLREWAGQVDQALMFSDFLLLEAKSKNETQKLLDFLENKGYIGEALNSNLILVQNSSGLEKTLRTRADCIIEAYDYATPSIATSDLTIAGGTNVRLKRNFHDLYLISTLEKFCTHTKGGLVYTMTKSSFKRGLKSNWSYFEIVNFLSNHLKQNLTPEFFSYLKGWQGTYKPVEIQKVVLVAFSSEDDLKAIADISAARELIYATISPKAVLVLGTCLRSFKHLLRSLGVEISKDHSSHEPDDESK